MKLPVLNSSARMTAQNVYATASYNAGVSAGVHPNGIFDDIIGGIGDVITGGIGKIPCIISKAGPKGIQCFTQCGPNLACLATCAGPTLANSILQCL